MCVGTKEEELFKVVLLFDIDIHDVVVGRTYFCACCWWLISFVLAILVVAALCFTACHL